MPLGATRRRRSTVGATGMGILEWERSHPDELSRPDERHGGMSTSATPTRGGCLGFVVDVWRGAVIGDFATEIGFFGALTQALLGFVPVIGTLCAVRDLIADMRMGDRLGMLLNA